MFKALSLLALLAASTAQAGVYEDRMNVANERARAERANSEASQASAEAAKYANMIYGFVAQLGGAQSGECTVSEFACYNGRCGEGREGKVGLGQLAGASFISGCSVNLNNGQACVINRYLSTTTWNYQGLIAYCYDADSVRHVYNYLGRTSGKKAIRKKR